MSMTNIRKIIHASLFTPTRSGWGLPILFWGKPGIGKSDIIEGASMTYGWGSPSDESAETSHCEVLSPGERGEGGYGCTPMPDSEGYISYPPPRWTMKFKKGGLLFHDEINTAPPAIQAPLLGLLLKRRIGGAQLHSHTRQMAAANDVADAAGGWDLAPPMANRLGHLPWEMPNEDEWTEWLMASDDVSTTSVTEAAGTIEKRVMAGWNEAWARQRGLVAGFIRAKPNNLHIQPASGSPDASKAWPSHRSWEAATRALASARVHGMSEADGDMFAAAFVGSGVLGELITYRKDADLPDPRELLDGKVSWKPDTKRLDRTFAVLGSTTSLIMSDVQAAGGSVKAPKDAKTMKRWEVYVKLLTDTAAGAVDLCWSPAKAIAKAGMQATTDDTKALMRKLLPMINAMEGK